MHSVQVLKSGCYRFFISGIICEDSEGHPLITKDGQPYKKLKLAVIDSEGYSFNVYDSIFGADLAKILQVLQAINAGHLTITADPFSWEQLIGAGGFCLIGLRAAKDHYPRQNYVECYLKPGYVGLMPQPDRQTYPAIGDKNE